MSDTFLDILPPVGECIYCLATEGLTDEHVIPFSLGGKLVLPKSSCTQCNKITHKFEGAVARRVLGQFRAAYLVQTRRPDERPNFVKIRTKSGELNWVPIEEVPDILFVPKSYEPEIILGMKSPNPWGGQGTWAIGGERTDYSKFQETHDWDGSVFVNTHPWQFGRMLAKIAHSYAVARLGIENFKPLLTDIIKGKVQNLAVLIGTETKHQDAGAHMHDLFLYSLRMKEASDSLYVAADVRLFADHNLPKYRVVVGILNEGCTVNTLTEKPRYTQAIEYARS